MLHNSQTVAEACPATRLVDPGDHFRYENRMFKLAFDPAQGLSRKMAALTAPSLEWLLGLTRLNNICARCADQPTSSRFIQRFLDLLQIRCRIDDEDLARIPRTGPLVVVSNHPFGAIDGLILAGILASVRDDVKIMANYVLGGVSNLRDLLILVDPFGGPGAKAYNTGPMRQCLRQLKAGGVLATFPAGEVAHLKLWERQVIDPQWNPDIAGIVRHTRVPVLPIFFNGRNGALFQLLGLVHPRLRTAMLAREIFRKQGQEIDVRIGSPIAPTRVDDFPLDEELTLYLRRRTFLLRHRAARTSLTRTAALAPQTGMRPPTPVAPAGEGELLNREVQSLPRQCVLIEQEQFVVYHAPAQRIPHCLAEIGRLRELTFRATGEGTGGQRDLDRFDNDYLHVFIWSRAANQIAGAYRLGQSDVLLSNRGKLGFYTATLFDFPADLLERIGPSLEMGRSFVCQEYQKSYLPLLLLWKGIGRFVVLNPSYRMLFGPVSISARYNSLSRQMMVQFLEMHHSLGPLASLVRPRNPFRVPPDAQGVDNASIRALLSNTDDLADLVADLEPDHKGIPVLLRQYLTLGAKLLAFNVDPDFSDVLDALLLVDLTRVPRKLMDRYFGRDAADQFLAYHGVQAIEAKAER